MEGKRSNIATWYRLGFAVLAVIGCLVMAAGVSFARYRTEGEGDLTLQTQATSYVYLGGVFNGEFTAGGGNWQVNAEGKPQLEFMLSNQGGTETPAVGDQAVTLRVLVSEGMGDKGLQLTLTTPDGKPIEGEVTAIPTTSPLYLQFGGGWVYTFRDANGEELTWELAGGERSQVTMTLTTNLTALPDTTLIQLQATGRPAND